MADDKNTPSAEDVQNEGQDEAVVDGNEKQPEVKMTNMDQEALVSRASLMFSIAALQDTKIALKKERDRKIEEAKAPIIEEFNRKRDAVSEKQAELQAKMDSLGVQVTVE